MFKNLIKNEFISKVISIFTKKILVFIIGFFSLIIQARVLGPENRGILAAILVLPSLFVVIAESGMRQSATYFIGKGELNKAKVYATTLYFFAFTSIFFSIVLFLVQNASMSSRVDISLIVISVVGFPFLVLNSGVRGIILGYQKTKEFGDNLMYPKLLQFLLLLSLLATGFLNLNTSIGLFALGSFLTGIFGLYSLNKIDEKFNISNFDFEILLSMLKSGLIYGVSFLFISVNYKIGILVGKSYLSEVELGNYAVTSQLVEVIWQVPAAICIVLFSKSSAKKCYNNEWNEYIQKTTFVQLLVLLVACLITLPIIIYILPSLIGDGYERVPEIFLYLIPGIIFMGAFKVLNVDFAGRGMPGVSLLFLPLLTIVNYFLSIELVQIYGVNGLAYSVSLSYVACGLSMMFLYKTKFSLNFFNYFKL